MLLFVGCKKGIKNQTKVFNQVFVFVVGYGLRNICSTRNIENGIFYYRHLQCVPNQMKWNVILNMLCFEFASDRIKVRR